MFSKDVRTQQNYQVADGTHRGKIMEAQELQVRNLNISTGWRNVLFLRVKVFHKDGPTNLFYNVDWNWGYRRFLRTLQDLNVLPEMEAEFDPDSLIGMDVEVTVANDTITELTKATLLRTTKPRHRRLTI